MAPQVGGMKLKKMEKKLNTHDDDFRIVYAYLKKLLDPLTEPMRKIGFKHAKEEKTQP